MFRVGVQVYGSMWMGSSGLVFVSAGGRAKGGRDISVVGLMEGGVVVGYKIVMSRSWWCYPLPPFLSCIYHQTAAVNRTASTLRGISLTFFSSVPPPVHLSASSQPSSRVNTPSRQVLTTLLKNPQHTHPKTTTKNKPKMSLRQTIRPLLQTAQAFARRGQQQQNSFSIMHNLRSFARSFEPHPFQRLPIASKPAPADWGKLVKRSAKQATVYVSLSPPPDDFKSCAVFARVWGHDFTTLFPYHPLSQSLQEA